MMVNNFRVLIDHLVIFFCDVPVLVFCLVFLDYVSYYLFVVVLYPF